jgi:hypothetical protein
MEGPQGGSLVAPGVRHPVHAAVRSGVADSDHRPGDLRIITETTGGAAPAEDLVARVAMLSTAHSCGRTAIIHPVAGSPSIPRRRKGRWRVPRWAGCGGCSSWWSR